jgi:hypothetical protein
MRLGGGFSTMSPPRPDALAEHLGCHPCRVSGKVSGEVRSDYEVMDRILKTAAYDGKQVQHEIHGALSELTALRERVGVLEARLAQAEPTPQQPARSASNVQPMTDPYEEARRRTERIEDAEAERRDEEMRRVDGLLASRSPVEPTPQQDADEREL